MYKGPAYSDRTPYFVTHQFSRIFCWQATLVCGENFMPDPCIIRVLVLVQHSNPQVAAGNNRKYRPPNSDSMRGIHGGFSIVNFSVSIDVPDICAKA